MLNFFSMNNCLSFVGIISTVSVSKDNTYANLILEHPFGKQKTPLSLHCIARDKAVQEILQLKPKSGDAVSITASLRYFRGELCAEIQSLRAVPEEVLHDLTSEQFRI